ncbi:uncharacterized protein (TIGR02118 family) [Nocardioides daedukensis]|uniref:Uncharacterized protein (TIGR02118 family) n=1 Tax=Nocardioides daedukensis TaxID=634462 RepID=A0A7Y9RW19_9ACTN|nr:EthD family reductase [Nocardioides daedukensis]NYG57696.1 uncharacterized protein (TIGR02118 family) [Nocardioides daedukensis]
MLTMMVLYGHPKDPAAFRRHYEEVHLPLARALPGVSNIRVSYDVHDVQGGSPYFAIFTCDFDDAAAYGDAMRSDAGRAVGADVPNYADGGVTVLTLGSD